MSAALQLQFGKKTTSSGITVYHFETDADMVLDSERNATLKEDLSTLFGNRAYTLTGDVTGTVTAAGDSGVVIDTEVGDDSHNHTGSTVIVDTANRVLISNASKTIEVSAVTSTELGYVSGVTGAIQAQLNNKSDSTHNHDTTYLKQALLGVSGGIAPLDSDGKIDEQYLPGYVDDVVEGTINDALTQFTISGETSACTPEAGKLYVDTAKNTTYRWSGTVFVAVGSGLALGETSSTAYRGDRGAAAYAHSIATHARTDATNTAGSTQNGYVVIDGTETVVYTHPSISVSSGTATETLSNGGTFSAISAFTVNSNGHVTAKTTKTYTLPTSVDIQSGSTQPTNQSTGDLWFETLS